MSTLVTSMSIVGFLVLWMFVSISGDNQHFIMMSLVACLVAWYFMVHRIKNKIRRMLKWKGQTTGVLTTIHPGGMIEIDGRSIYREQYAEYQFEHLGKTYTSAYVDVIFDVGGTKPPNLNQSTKALFDVLASVAKGSSYARLNSRDLYDENDPADVLDREIHNQRKVGDTVTVYFDTNNPENSTLVRRTDVPFDAKVRCVALIIFILVMTGVMIVQG